MTADVKHLLKERKTKLKQNFAKNVVKGLLLTSQAFKICKSFEVKKGKKMKVTVK